ncbi:MAG: hypothetical protein GY915_03550, partial [bacterium]|nr:hypothetical protein [bacterium]
MALSGFSRKKRSSSGRKVIGALDVGGSKVGCAIAVANSSGDEGNTLNLLGVGQQAAKGLRDGVVVDMEETRDAIVKAVHTAEHMAGEQISSVVLAVPARQLRSEQCVVEADLAGRAFTPTDLKSLLSKAVEKVQRPN